MSLSVPRTIRPRQAKCSLSRTSERSSWFRASGVDFRTVLDGIRDPDGAVIFSNPGTYEAIRIAVVPLP